MLHRGELRASESHEDTAVCYRDASSSIMPSSSHSAIHPVKISDESPEAVFLLQHLLCMIWDYVQYRSVSLTPVILCHVDLHHLLTHCMGTLFNQSQHCEAENPFVLQSEVEEQRNLIHLLCLIHYFLLFCCVPPYLSFH